MTEYSLDLQNAVRYAGSFAYSRNPDYFNFDGIGGDCTNFISQCIYAAEAVMNYTKDTGWYYVSLNNRAPAWSGVEFFYNFMINNKSVGPFGYEVSLSDINIGDVVQLGSSAGFYHSLLVVDIKDSIPLVAAHTYDAYARPLSSYTFEKARVLRIDKARKW